MAILPSRLAPTHKLGHQAFAALTVNDYGQFDELIRGRRRRWRKWRNDKGKDGVS
jgi:hypothetical protein